MSHPRCSGFRGRRANSLSRRRHALSFQTGRHDKVRPYDWLSWVPGPFPHCISHENLALAEIQVHDPQTHAFHQAQTAAIEKLYDQAVDASELGNHLSHFFFGQDRRQAFGSLGHTNSRGSSRSLCSTSRYRSNALRT